MTNRCAMGGRLLLMAAGMSCAAAGYAGETAQFLKIGVGARAVGMGGAYTAVGEDLTAMAWNPAGLAGMEKREVAAMYANLVAETHYSFMGYGQPTKYGAFGAGLMYLGQGSLDGRDAQGRANGGFTASDMAFGLSFAKKLFPKLGLAVTAKLVRINRGSDTGYPAAGHLVDNPSRRNFVPQRHITELPKTRWLVETGYLLPSQHLHRRTSPTRRA